MHLGTENPLHAPRTQTGVGQVSRLLRSSHHGLPARHRPKRLGRPFLASDTPVASQLWRAALLRTSLASEATAAGLASEFDGFASNDTFTDAAKWLALPAHACSRVELSLNRDGRLWRKALPCRTWRCPDCARRLRAGVMRLAASGSPNRMLTLTCSPLAEPDPNLARDLLHKAWRTLRLTIARELVKPTDSRWRNTAPSRGHEGQPGGNLRQPARPSGSPPALPYFAVVERHKSGRPHLHILLRSEYIPQRWLSRQMQRLASSPVCDIRKVNGTKQAAAYVAKYIGKAPARFGHSRAYWYTRNWLTTIVSDPEETAPQKLWFSVRPRLWQETIEEIGRSRPIIDLSPDGWFSIRPRSLPFNPIVRLGRFGPIYERKRPPPDAAGVCS